MELRHLTDDDVPDAARAFVTSLGGQPPKKPERYQRYWDVPTSLGAWDDRGRLLGVAARFPSRFTAVGGAALQCTAVPSVGVRPDAHRRGVGRALLERQVAEAVDRGDAVLALNASEVAIYGRYGYGPTSTWWSVEADPRMLEWRADAPRVAAGSVEEVDDDTAAELAPALHEATFGRWAGELGRHQGWWSVALEPREGEQPPVRAVHRDAAGEVDAYVSFTVEQHFDDMGFANRVELQDAIGLTSGVDAALLRWLLERRLVGRFTAERLDPRSGVPWMLADPRRLRTRATGDAVWVRVLDVPTVVTARTTGWGDGAVSVAVRDPLVEANTGTWRIGAADGHLTCDRTDAEPDLVLGVDLLAPLLWGFVDVGRLVSAGRVEVTRPGAVPVLQRLLATAEPSWCSTGF